MLRSPLRAIRQQKLEPSSIKSRAFPRLGRFTTLPCRRTVRNMTRKFDRSATVEIICDRLSKGEALAAICADQDMPSTRRFLQWADEDEDVAAEYSRALAARAEWFAAEHDRIRRTAVDRETAAAARVQLAGLEWQMGRMAPKRYGDRLDVAVDASVDLGAIIDRGRQRVLEAKRVDDPALLAPGEGGDE
jgi:hypothetical protein